MSIALRENPAIWLVGGGAGALGALAIYLSQNPGAWDEIFDGVLNNDIEVTPKAEYLKERAETYHPTNGGYEYDKNNGICEKTGGVHVAYTIGAGLYQIKFCWACGKELKIV